MWKNIKTKFFVLFSRKKLVPETSIPLWDCKNNYLKQSGNFWTDRKIKCKEKYLLTMVWISPPEKNQLIEVKLRIFRQFLTNERLRRLLLDQWELDNFSASQSWWMSRCWWQQSQCWRLNITDDTSTAPAVSLTWPWPTLWRPFLNATMSPEHSVYVELYVQMRGAWVVVCMICERLPLLLGCWWWPVIWEGHWDPRYPGVTRMSSIRIRPLTDNCESELMIYRAVDRIFISVCWQTRR